MKKEEIMSAVEQVLMENYELDFFNANNRNLVSTKIAMALSGEIDKSQDDEVVVTHNLGSYIEENLKKEEMFRKGILEPSDVPVEKDKKVENKKSVTKKSTKQSKKPDVIKTPSQVEQKKEVKSSKPKAKKPFKLD